MAEAIVGAAFMVLLGVVSITDLRARIVPDRVLIAYLLVALPAFTLADPGSLASRAGWAAGAGGLLGLAHLLRPEAMGLGDAKLVGVLAFHLGESVMMALVVGSAAGAAAGVAFALLGRRRAILGTAIPFAPFLAAGALCATWVGGA